MHANLPIGEAEDFNMHALKAILEVKEKLELNREPRLVTVDKVQSVYEEIRKSINLVASTCTEHFASIPPTIPDFKENNKQLIHSMRKIYDKSTEKKNRFDMVHSKEKSLLSFLGRENDENFHSDFISSFLETSKMGAFAGLFFRELILKTTGEEIEMPFLVSSRREVTLESLVSNLPECMKKKRIDILASSESHILVIENKLMSFESENQTEDYYTAVERSNSILDRNKQKKIVGIMLSPTGQIPQSDKFLPLTYFDLFEILGNLHSSVSFEMSSCFQGYFKSLYEIFYSSQLRYLEDLKQFWRKNV